MSTPSWLRGRSLTCPIDATTSYFRSNSFFTVRALVGDSTTTSDLTTYRLLHYPAAQHSQERPSASAASREPSRCQTGPIPAACAGAFSSPLRITPNAACAQECLIGADP